MLRNRLSFFVSSMLSIPIFPKIMGIGFLVAMLFGGVTLIQTRSGTSSILQQILEQKMLSTTEMLTEMVEQPVSTGDIHAVLTHINNVQKIYPEIRYIIIRSADGEILASTFNKALPEDLMKIQAPHCPPNCGTQSFQSGEGMIYESRAPILEGEAGTIQVGFQDDLVSRELARFTGTVLWGILLCLSIGVCLALFLTHILTRPIRHLMDSANQIREGKFETRAEIFYNDEFGRLAKAFNQMAEALYKYREEVRAKEKARISLIERTVQVLEDERKSISRELHDHLGQSLLAILLQIQSGCDDKIIANSTCQSVEKAIRQTIAEVRELAWGMRPSILDDYGLDSALARHIQDVSKHSGLNIDYHFSSSPGLDRLPGRIEVSLFRITQEAITNIQKHAKASHASVVVLRQRHEITLLVEDDGQGFDASMLSEKGDKCLGLLGMRERVALLGGSVVIETIPGEGTTIRAKIPIEEDFDVVKNIDS